MLMLCWCLQAASQCSIGVSLKKICLGATTVFTPNPATSNDSAFVWNFGDGSTSGQVSPTYQYQKAGTFTVTLRIYKFGGGFCEPTPVVVNVFAKPTAQYSRLSAYAQCFESNNFLFTDLSQPGVSNAPIKQRTIVYDDGAFDLDIAPYQPNFSHIYTNAAGGKYKVVLEVKDTNDCVAQYIDSVLVYPQTNPIQLSVFQDVQCNKTNVVLTQNSGYNATNANKITWILGNGDTLYAPWNNLSYTYISKGFKNYEARVIVADKNGCIIKSGPIVITTINVTDTIINVYTKGKSCFNNNLFAFGNRSTFLNRKWSIGLNGDTVVYQQNGFQPDTVEYHRFKSCGKATIKMEYNYLNCKIIVDTPVFVYGPGAFIENDTIKTRNKVQCTVKDTVLFRVPDINCYYGNNLSNMHYLWNFDDPFAPPCTTSTKFGINVNQNCNYSIDSIAAKHFYTQPGVKCYQPSLWVIDSTRNCEDFDTTTLRLTPPKAGWDSTSVPIRRGVYYDSPFLCENVYRFRFDDMVPSCTPDTVWLLPDSACFPQQWIIGSVRGVPIEKDYFYSKICKPNPENKLTYGVVATNGKDALGNICYDTAWYPLYYKNKENVDFTIEFLDDEVCAPFNIRLQLKDSVQKRLKQLVWNLGNNTPNVVQDFNGPNDTLVNPVFVTYNENDYYRITAIGVDKNGCDFVAVKTIGIGKGYSFLNNNPKACVGEELEFYFYPFYLSNDEGRYWEDTTRRNAGKEQLYWNFGDDTTWVRGLTTVKHTYPKTGIYQVSIAFKDSGTVACWDTVALSPMQVDVSQIMLNTSVVNDTFFCAPSIVTYTDASLVKSGDGSIAPTFKTRLWDFGPDKPNSTLKQPAVFYPQNGKYTASLFLESEQGCTVDTTISIVILGPEPRFVIANDTFGCAPYTVILDNTTQKKLRNWIWYFNDQNNSIKSTSTDTNVSFVYTKPGIYRIDLVGEDQIFNTTTGTNTNCAERFPYLPDPSAFHSRQVLVLATDTLTIVSKDTLCPEQLLTVTTGNTNRINQVRWIWGTGDTTLVDLNKSATYTYDTAGVYRLRVEPIITVDTQCVAPKQKTIYVGKPIADFEFDGQTYPNFTFTNASTKAVRYLWDFGQPSSGQNTSTLKDPSHNYGNENKQFTVCLMAFDANDCMDSICKVLPVKSSVKIPNVFTPDNADGKNDAFDIDIEGWEKYDLMIYNRWGTKVFEGQTDGFYNDGINWNGKNKNAGEPCPEGVYYVIFKYKLITSPNEEVYHGTITLIRE